MPMVLKCGMLYIIDYKDVLPDLGFKKYFEIAKSYLL